MNIIELIMFIIIFTVLGALVAWVSRLTGLPLIISSTIVVGGAVTLYGILGAIDRRLRKQQRK